MRYLILCFSFMFVAGCGPARQAMIDVSDENIKNAEAMRQVSENCLSVWPIQSGFIKGALGSRIEELPAEAIAAIDELDRLAGLPEQTDYELGMFLGLKVRLLSSVVQKAIEKYAPDVGVLLPLVF
jgi:hypothetical protein